MARGVDRDIPCLDHLDEGSNRVHARHDVCTTRACICDGNHRPGEGEELFKRLKELTPRSIVPRTIKKRAISRTLAAVQDTCRTMVHREAGSSPCRPSRPGRPRVVSTLHAS